MDKSIPFVSREVWDLTGHFRIVAQIMRSGDRKQPEDYAKQVIQLLGAKPLPYGDRPDYIGTQYDTEAIQESIIKGLHIVQAPPKDNSERTLVNLFQV